MLSCHVLFPRTLSEHKFFPSSLCMCGWEKAETPRYSKAASFMEQIKQPFTSPFCLACPTMELNRLMGCDGFSIHYLVYFGVLGPSHLFCTMQKHMGMVKVHCARCEAGCQLPSQSDLSIWDCKEIHSNFRHVPPEDAIVVSNLHTPGLYGVSHW